MEEIKYKDVVLKTVDFSLGSLIDLFPIEEKLQAYNNPLMDKAYKDSLSALQKRYLDEVAKINEMNIPEDMKEEFIETQGEICKTEKVILEREFKKSILDNGNLLKQMGAKILSNWEEVEKVLSLEDIQSQEFQNSILRAYQQSFLKKNTTTTN